MAYEVFTDLLQSYFAAQGTVAGDYLSSSAGLGQLIRAAQDAGVSGRETLAAYRAVGGEVTDANFWQLRNAILTTTGEPSGLSFSSLLSGEGVTAMPGGRAGLYQVNFRVFASHDVDTGLPSYSVQNYAVTQRDFDITRAIGRMSDLMDFLDDDTHPYGRWLGFEVTSVYRYAG